MYEKELFAVIVLVLVIYWNSSSSTENFISSEDQETILHYQYINDLRVIAGYVGPFMGNIYVYLRAKYLFDPESPINDQLMYLPKPGDKVLTDSILPESRIQVMAWIDSENKIMQMRYPNLDSYKKTDALTYNVNSDRSLTITHLVDGKTFNYLL